MLQIGWPPQISNMLTHQRILRHHDVTKFEKSFKIENFQIFFIPEARSAVQSKPQPRSGCGLRNTCREAT